MSNPRKQHIAKSAVERDFYYRNLRRQQPIDATYLENDSISTDTPLKEDMDVALPSQTIKKKYTPKPKVEPPFYKSKLFQSVFATVFGALVILIIINVNREVGVISERLTGTCKEVENLHKENAEIRLDIKSFQPIFTEIEVLKVKMVENNKPNKK